MRIEVDCRQGSRRRGFVKNDNVSVSFGWCERAVYLMTVVVYFFPNCAPGPAALCAVYKHALLFVTISMCFVHSFWLVTMDLGIVVPE